MSRFENKIVFITGASSGIGEALAREFARQGAHVALAARRTDRLNALKKEIEGMGRKAVAVTCDVTQDGSLESAVQVAREQLGPLDVVVANAGYGVAGPIEKLKLQDYRNQFETNVFGVLRTLFATLEDLKKTRGTAVLIGSVAGHISLPGSSPYAMSKFAVRALADAIRYELMPQGVAVTLISPGFVSSEIRQVDNSGAHHGEAPDPIPAWLRMPTEKAARDIVRATYRKKAERIVTGHGRVFVFIKRHFDWFIRLAVGFGVRGRREPK
jgi:NADP-dependent 3-hydroxy acid dehydrogenase YdfG